MSCPIPWATAPMRRNVLIFHTGALGDFIMSWPLALAAGRLFAQSRVAYVSAAQKGALAEQLLRIDSIDVESGWHILFSKSPAVESLDPRVRKWLDSTQLVFAFGCEPGDQWSQNMAALAPGAKVFLLQSQNAPAPENEHITDSMIRQLAETPALQNGVQQLVRSINDRGVSGIANNPDGPIIIHPGSGAPRKSWPIERFVELAERLSSRGEKVIAIIGEAEQQRMSADEKSALERVVKIEAPATYIALQQLIKTAKYYIGNDTGPTHLAAVSGVNTIALFGTDPARWKPLGPRVTVISAKGISAISVEEVERAAAAQSQSSPPQNNAPTHPL